MWKYLVVDDQLDAPLLFPFCGLLSFYFTLDEYNLLGKNEIATVCQYILKCFPKSSWIGIQSVGPM